MSNDSYVVEQNTVSERTLNEIRKAYTAVRYAYLHSTEIPTVDTDTRIQIDIDALPENVTLNDVSQDENGNFYIPVRELQKIANRVGTPVILTDKDGNNITVTDLGDVKSDTGNVVSQVKTDEATTEFETRPVEETKQQETKPVTPVLTEPTTEPETKKATDNKPAETKPVETKPAETSPAVINEPSTSVVHHDAEYKTVHHDAEYKTVHHDATYKTVHHDAVTHEETQYELVTYERCGYCGECYDTTHSTREEYRHWLELHEHGSSSTFWEEIPVANIVVTDSEAWDEQVVDTPAWDEQILVKEAWDEQVLVKDAWDEVVYH